MMHLVTDGFLKKGISAEISIDIFVPFPYLSQPIFSQRLARKHLSDYYPNHFMLHNSATQKLSTTLQRVDCNGIFEFE